MITTDPQKIIAEARSLLKRSALNGAGSLDVSDEYLREGDWLHLIIFPTTEGVSALDYVDTIEAIENTLRQKFGEEILIVSAKP